jgi:hypothetical protein
MNRGQKVRVKSLPSVEPAHRGRTGTVLRDSAPDETVDVEFDDEAIAHPFNADDLELVA